MVDLWDLVNEGLVLVMVGLIGLAAWYARLWLRQNLTANQLGMVSQVAAMAVMAAEQLGGEAEEKKRAALGIAGDWLAAHGLEIDVHTLDAAIEAAVFAELNNGLSTISLESPAYLPGAAVMKAEAAE